jgi:hypothetical protein
VEEEEGECGPQKDRGLVTANGGEGRFRLLSLRRRKRGFHDPLRVRPSSLFILFGGLLPRESGCDLP